MVLCKFCRKPIYFEVVVKDWLHLPTKRHNVEVGTRYCVQKDKYVGNIKVGAEPKVEK